MRKIILTLSVAFAAFTLAACDETYRAVPGTNPPQIVVEDDDGKLDDTNIRQACSRFGFEVSKTQYLTGDDDSGEAALVTCKQAAS